MSVKLPESGMIFWPVGCGDSTTVVGSKDIIMQVDLHHLVKSEDESDPAVPVIDELVPLLPKKNGKPYLAVFVLTHPDQDHIRGFADFLKQVHIGELWFSPRVFDEYKKDFCDDAKAFRAEADRRVAACIKSGTEAKSGDRVRVIGYNEDVFDKDAYKDLPSYRKAYPGQEITEFDGVECKNLMRAFIHAPFKDDCASGDRNETSVAMQIHLFHGGNEGKALLFGDLAYPTVKKIFELTNAKDSTKVQWNVLLAPHHCSKSVMFWDTDGKGEKTFQKDVMDYIENAQFSPNWIVASSNDFPVKDEPSKNPPHRAARDKYELITEKFLCTHEHVDEDQPHPIVFEVTEDGLCYRRPATERSTADRLKTAVVEARGSNEPPKQRVGFGG